MLPCCRPALSEWPFYVFRQPSHLSLLLHVSICSHAANSMMKLTLEFGPTWAPIAECAACLALGADLRPRLSRCQAFPAHSVPSFCAKPSPHAPLLPSCVELPFFDALPDLSVSSNESRIIKAACKICHKASSAIPSFQVEDHSIGFLEAQGFVHLRPTHFACPWSETFSTLEPAQAITSVKEC